MSNMIDKVKKIRHGLYRTFYSCLPIEKNKIIFWANSFKQYGCSPKYITEYVYANYPKEFDLVWVFERGVKVPKELYGKARVVYYFSLEYLKELHTAKFVVCNMRTGSAYYWKKRKEQIYIQTWHSSLRLKKIEGDAEEYLSDAYIEDCKEDSKKIDLLLSGCRFSTDIFKCSFWYDGQIMECGTPRCDILINQDSNVRNKVYGFFNIDNSKKLLVYAPTFRSNKASDFLGMDFTRLNKALGVDWTIGARLHPNVLADVIPDGAISMSSYPDMQELLVAADILITDFSSSMFDMAISGKPCILYAPDLEEYLEKERGMYFDIHELPFKIARSMDELEYLLRDFDLKKYQEDVDSFMKSIESFEDGHAAERVYNYIREKM